MEDRYFAALALASASPLAAQTPAAPTAPDFSYATPLPGSWAYAPTADGGQALFRDTSGRTQFTIQCTRSQRRIAIIKPAVGAASAIFVWGSSASRSLPATFDPTLARLVAPVTAFDPLLDALAFSRGRIAVSVAGGPALVMPAWAEISRVIEDCRS